MAAILILFASFDGQAERIAQRVAQALAARGHATTLLPARAPTAAAEIERADAVIVGGAIRYGRHARELEALVRAQSGRLAQRHGAFFSVSMSAARPGEGLAQARRYVDDFVRRTGWHPRSVALFAGALRYTRYNPFVRFMMRLISSSTGAATDTSRDHEYTDWRAVDRFAGEQATRLEALATTA
jgi:menaquinone-dependent protoporphyrinogen oxidase